MDLTIGSLSNPVNTLKFSPNIDFINLNTPDINLSNLLTQMTSGNNNYPHKFALLAGDDYLSDRNTDSIILGNQGNDQIFGNGGNDLIHGGLGLDILNGGEGNDRLAGDQNNDTLTGGGGSDQFIWGHTNDGHDLITDFTDGIDKISLKNSLSWNSLELNQVGQDVIITTIPGSIRNISLTLKNFNLSSIDVNDFVIPNTSQSFYNASNATQWLA
ncbi:MAG: calcium-binding protein, partial [Microcoleaceae cyanobacterium]